MLRRSTLVPLLLISALVLALVPAEAQGGKFRDKLDRMKNKVKGDDGDDFEVEEEDLEEEIDIDSLLHFRDHDRMLLLLPEGMQERVKSKWSSEVLLASQRAYERNREELYPNPAIQAFVNRLGQRLIPTATSSSTHVSFRVLEDPLPYADALATGTIYLSTGLISLLDNESQLAFLLMHEAGHVVLSHHFYQAIEDVKAEKREERMSLVGGAAGAVVGRLGGESLNKIIVGAAAGYALAPTAERIVSKLRARHFSKRIQRESDQFAAEVLLRNGYDAREAPILMAKIGSIVRKSNPSVSLAFGYSKDLPKRSEKISELLFGSYKPTVDRILSGNGFQLASPRFTQLMAELKRDNGMAALERDLFAIARANLEEAYAVRSDDPLTLYGLGMLYRTIGRDPETLSRAETFLRACVRFDEGRYRFPDVYLQYAVELMSREDPKFFPEIQDNLKKYVVLYRDGKGEAMPREERFIYDSLDMTGDRSWSPLQQATTFSQGAQPQTAGKGTAASVARP